VYTWPVAGSGAEWGDAEDRVDGLVGHKVAGRLTNVEAGSVVRSRGRR
jgi:hypothetical protein